MGLFLKLEENAAKLKPECDKSKNPACLRLAKYAAFCSSILLIYVLIGLLIYSAIYKDSMSIAERLEINFWGLSCVAGAFVSGLAASMMFFAEDRNLFRVSPEGFLELVTEEEDDQSSDSTPTVDEAENDDLIRDKNAPTTEPMKADSVSEIASVNKSGPVDQKPTKDNKDPDSSSELLSSSGAGATGAPPISSENLAQRLGNKSIRLEAFTFAKEISLQQRSELRQRCVTCDETPNES